MVLKVKDEVLAKLSERLIETDENILSPATNNTKLNCWACGKYDGEAEVCSHCDLCNVWALKKIFLHNRRYLRHLDTPSLHKMGFSDY